MDGAKEGKLHIFSYTRFKTAEAAAKTAMLGVARAFEQGDPAVVAAHTAHAIAVAVSTSRSYTAFVAATTSAEGAALYRCGIPSPLHSFSPQTSAR